MDDLFPGSTVVATPPKGPVDLPPHLNPRRPGPPSKRPAVTPKRVIAGVFLALVASLGWSIGGYLTAPGTDTIAARLAGWARDHRLGIFVNKLEKIQYDLHKPKTGGTPTGIPIGSPAPPVVPSGPDHLPTPRTVPAQAGAALPGEGAWQTMVTVKGVPAVRAAYIRPDSEHTSYLTAIAWMDQKLLKFQIHPGTQEPGGGPWSVAPTLGPAEYPGLVAAFNSGFKLDGARGGYYAEGRLARPLRDGAASLVIYKNGKASVGQWGRDVTMTPDVATVRQNLDLLVDGGVLAPTVDENNTSRWGYTLGNKAFVWRSGVGITRSGALIYAAGNALSVRTIGQVLKAAGAVRAMELDINPEWTTYYWYEHPAAGGIVPHKLAADMQKPGDRYFHVSSRDFFAVHQR